MVDFSDERFVKDMSLNNHQNPEFINLPETSSSSNTLGNKSLLFNSSKRRSNCVSNNPTRNSNNSNRTFDALASTIASVASGESGSFEQAVVPSEHNFIDNDNLSMDLIGNFLKHFYYFFFRYYTGTKKFFNK